LRRGVKKDFVAAMRCIFTVLFLSICHHHERASRYSASP
jgi:hypothetical protein